MFVLPTITGLLPSNKVSVESMGIPANIELADPNFHIPTEIDILLGEFVFFQALEAQQLRLSNETTILHKTKFGWIVSGQVYNRDLPSAQFECHITSCNLDTQLSRFWELDVYPTTKHQSPDERSCEEHFTRTTCRDSSERYVVRLPFNSKKQQLASAHSLALRRFYNLENKLSRDAELHNQYTQFMEEYIALGHMTKVTDTARANEGFYLPHHAVIKETSLTTKLRVVFDGSVTSDSGIALNNTLMVGPTLQDDIIDILLRFRSHIYVFVGDIEKMYRQVVIHPDDRKFQKILWRDNKKGALDTFELNTVTYGTACAPFLAVRALQQLAQDESTRFPLAAKAFTRDFYVDDLLTGASSMEEAKRLHKQIVQLAHVGGFNLRQWVSNTHAILGTDNASVHCDQVCLDTVGPRKTLGVFWNAPKDVLSYTIKRVETAPHLTKRKMLSNLAQIFDPLGLIGPIVVKAKLLIQTLWKLKLQWDELVPSDIQDHWQSLNRELRVLEQFTIPRVIQIKHAVEVQLHGFCDASERAYGACVYLRSRDCQNRILTRLICAKSRVAPVTTTTIPRLELCAAVLLAQLTARVANTLSLKCHTTRLWSDSTIVLQWIAIPPYKLKTFVANRVVEILDHSQVSDWSHVPSTQNPADALSRGQNPTEFINNALWLVGPVWLSDEPHLWPDFPPSSSANEPPELKRIHAFVSKFNSESILTKFSSFTTLKRVLAYCLRFINNASGKTKQFGPLSLTELHASHTQIMRMVQHQEFSHEIEQLQNQKSISSRSKILGLAPFLDEHCIMRVGGRLKHSAMDCSKKYQLDTTSPKP